jgi:succinylglutamate desuccinylase
MLKAGKNYNQKVKRERKLLHSLRLLGIEYNPQYFSKSKRYKVRYLNRLQDPKIKKINVIKYGENN